MKPSNVEITACRLCGSEQLKSLFSLGEQYVNDFVTEDVVRSGYAGCPRCPIDVTLCEECRLVQLKHTAPQSLLYERKYWYKSGTSPLMQAALKDVADAAMRSVKLEPGDVVLDIGSNDGTLLRTYNYFRTLLEYEGMSDPGEAIIDCDYMGADRYRPITVGIEPASNLAEAGSQGVDVFINDFWSFETYRKAMLSSGFDWGIKDPAKGVKLAKIVTALGMFYDLPNPQKFIDDVAKVLHPDGVFIAQLMCLQQTVDKLDVGNFCHEHLEFYPLTTLHRMFESAGLRIYDLEMNDVNGGSYRLYACHDPGETGRKPDINVREDAAARVLLAGGAEYGLAEASTLMTAYHRMLANAAKVKSFILQERAKGKKTYVIGASTKGNTILQWYGLDSTLIDGACDADSAKWGRYTVGTGIPIMSKEAVRQLDPDYMLMLPYAFEREILEQERDQKWRKRGGRFIIPIPEMRVV